MQSSTSGESVNTADEATLALSWNASAQVFSTCVPDPLPSVAAPRLEEFPSHPPIRPVLASLLLHLAAVLVVLFLLPLFPLAFPFKNQITIQQPEVHSDHIIYVPTPYLPQLADSGGAKSGRAGAPGGRTGHHAKQMIQVARKSVVVKAVAEAKLPQLPPSVPAANLVSFSARASTPALAPHQPVVPVSPVSPTRPISQLAMPSAGPIAVPPAPDMGTRDLSKKALVVPVVEVVAPAPSLGSRKVSELTKPRMLGAEDAIAPAPPNVPEQLAAHKWDALAPQASPPAAPVKAEHSGERTSGDKGDSNGGSSGAQQLVLSGSPGEQVGVPAGVGSGSMGLSPMGMTSLGLGGMEAGSGVGAGSGSGSGKTGSGSGAASSGTGLGASPTASGGGSRFPGPGGSGTGMHPGSLPGVSIQGGNVYVPSFATSAGTGTNLPPEHGPHRSPTITIVATSRSGGALNIYGLLKGSKVYTVYLDTSLGPVVLQYAEPKPASGSQFNSDLSAPEPIDTGLPAKIPRAPTIITCVLGRDGGLHNIRVMKAGSADVAHAIETALQSWRFRPARNSRRAVDVDAVLGFDIDTR